ncbi:hypothetical protein, partial [uncultured Prochlorococcus sp.]|uniref:hypothetical protein n=1 Tax=uncultured Prochlorococcus sp. TaxID=159733 RepID=UPI002585B144
MRLICIYESENQILRTDFSLRYSRLFYLKSSNEINIISVLFDDFADFNLVKDDVVINYRIYDI